MGIFILGVVKKMARADEPLLSFFWYETLAESMIRYRLRAAVLTAQQPNPCQVVEPQTTTVLICRWIWRPPRKLPEATPSAVGSTCFHHGGILFEGPGRK